MNQSNRKRQHFEPQQKEEDNDENDNRSIDGVNREWSFNQRELLENNTNNNDGRNELSEMELKIAALEVQIFQFS
jgi:hypothetical protein